MHYLQKISTIIYLDVPLPTLYKRLNNLIERGVILKHNQTFEDLFAERTILYKKYSHIIITDTDLSNITNTYIKYKH